MVAYMNRESLQLTAETGIAHYWTRSRQKLWKKGEESGDGHSMRGRKKRRREGDEDYRRDKTAARTVKKPEAIDIRKGSAPAKKPRQVLPVAACPAVQTFVI